MKYLVITLGLVATLLSSCSKDDRDCSLPKVTAPTDEITALHQYISDSSITATFDPSGFYYHIQTEGSKEKPDMCSVIGIGYKGMLINGKVIDQQNYYEFALSSLIYGWQLGVPKIGKGGKITLYLPPSFGYGKNAVGQIPANSILVFEVDLQNFRK